MPKTLTKNPEQRPSATDLLAHPFITKAKTRVLLQPLLDKQDQIISRIGRDAALGIEPEEEGDDDDDEDNGEGTVRRSDVKKGKKNRSDSTIEESDCGTVVITDSGSTGYGTTVLVNSDDDDDDDTGTIRKPHKSKLAGSGNYVPPFLDHIKKQQAEPPITPGNPKYAHLSLDQLKKMVEEIDLQKEKEIATIRDKYATNKRSLMAAIDERNKQKS